MSSAVPQVDRSWTASLLGGYPPAKSETQLIPMRLMRQFILDPVFPLLPVPGNLDRMVDNVIFKKWCV